MSRIRHATRPSMTIGDIEEAIDRIKYKPGWSFRSYPGRWEGPHLAISATLPDAYHEGEMVDLCIRSHIPPLHCEGELWRWLNWRIDRIDGHERREFFLVDGIRVFDPHAPGAEEDE